VGLGSPEQVGKQTLKIVSDDGGGSSLHSTTGILREETIQIKTLDDFGLDNVGFIKMDVEENELFVLKGGLETIQRNRWPTILFESNFENTELFDYIRAIGYKDVIRVSGCHNMFLTVS
jgi:FkbM family methyltransferase